MKSTDQKQFARDIKEITRGIRALGGSIEYAQPAETCNGRTPQILALFDGVESIPGCPKIDRTPIKSSALKPWGLHIPIPNH